MTVGAEEYKRALRRFATGISVVTVASDGELHGMTATAFASVSLDPPLVLVCLEKTSRTRALVRSANAFAVNLLRVDQEDISRSFSTRGPKKFQGLDHDVGTTGAPLIRGAICTLECDVEQIIAAGDHDIVIGEVVATRVADGDPLLYYDQNYRGLREL